MIQSLAHHLIGDTGEKANYTFCLTTGLYFNPMPDRSNINTCYDIEASCILRSRCSLPTATTSSSGQMSSVSLFLYRPIQVLTRPPPGHFYFTKLLLPTLATTAHNIASKTVRVVNVSSWGHFTGDLDFNTFRDSPARKKRGTTFLYAQSKFGNIVFSNELARRYREQGIVSISLHPGAVASDLQRHMVRVEWQSGFSTSHVRPFIIAVEYLIPWGRLGRPKKGTEDSILAKQLWEYMEEQIKNVWSWEHIL